LKKKLIIFICLIIVGNLVLSGCNDISAELKKFYGTWQRTEQNGEIVTFNFLSNNTYELIDDDTYLSGNFSVEDNILLLYIEKIPWENNYLFSEENTKLTLTYTLTDADNTSVTYTKII
jgi:hypothetical protein